MSGPFNIFQASLIQFPKKVNAGDIQYQGERSDFTNSLSDVYMEDMSNSALVPVFDFTTANNADGTSTVTLNKVVRIDVKDNVTRGRVPLASFNTIGSSTGGGSPGDIQCTSLTASMFVNCDHGTVTHGLGVGYLTSTGSITGTSLSAGATGTITGGTITGGTITGTSLSAGATGTITGGTISVTGDVSGKSFTAIFTPVDGSSPSYGGVTGGLFTCTSLVCTGTVQGASISAVVPSVNGGSPTPGSVSGGAFTCNTLSVAGTDLMQLLARYPGPQGIKGDTGSKGDTGAIGTTGPKGVDGVSPIISLAPFVTKSLVVNGKDTPADASTGAAAISNGYLRATRLDINHQVGYMNYNSDGSVQWIQNVYATVDILGNPYTDAYPCPGPYFTRVSNIIDSDGHLQWSAIVGQPDAASIAAGGAAGGAIIGAVAGFFGGLLGSSFASTSADGALLTQAITSSGSSFTDQLASRSSVLSSFDPLGLGQSGTAPSNPWLDNAAWDPFLNTNGDELIATLPSPSLSGTPPIGNNYNATLGPEWNARWGDQFAPREDVWDTLDLGSRASSFGGSSFQSQADAGMGQSGFNVGTRRGSYTGIGTGGFGNSIPSVGNSTVGPGAAPSATHVMFRYGKGAYGAFKRWALQSMPNTVPASGVADIAYRLSPTVTGVASTGSGVAGVFPTMGLPTSYGASI